MIDELIKNDFAAVGGSIYIPSENIKECIAEYNNKKFAFARKADAVTAEAESIENIIRTNPSGCKASHQFRGMQTDLPIILPYFIACKGKAFINNLAKINRCIFAKTKKCNPSKNLLQISLDSRKFWFEKAGINNFSLQLKWSRHLSKTAKKMKYMLNNHFYDPEENLGVIIKDKKFYAYSIQEPYSLYEKRNNKYYCFGKAVVGIELKLLNNQICLQNPVVINNYTHPALKKKNESFQEICFEKPAETYKNKYLEIKRVLYKAKEALTKGYKSQMNAWHPLTDGFYFTPCRKPIYKTTNI